MVHLTSDGVWFDDYPMSYIKLREHSLRQKFWILNTDKSLDGLMFNLSHLPDVNTETRRGRGPNNSAIS